MKVEKNKIVFAAVLAILLAFMVSYSIWIMGDGGSANENLEQTLVPELEEDQREYDSKLDAINDLKEVRETNAPSIYDEKMIDSLGYYNPDLPELEKERIVDSIYAAGRIKYSDRSYKHIGEKRTAPKKVREIDSTELKREQKIAAKELGLEHQLFFAADPKVNELSLLGSTDKMIYAVVDGNQVVKANSRLRMRLVKEALINNEKVPKHTPIYGFISFKPNRALIRIENIQHRPTSLKAFDLRDGSEGIYVENNFRAEAANEIFDDIISDINIPSVPEVSGITKVLRRNNRKVKVTVLNNYQLILKPKL
tara:strand:- start:7231 stop:8160 length:930 start_codon:yes stop_codon:yes gene_type:complete